VILLTALRPLFSSTWCLVLQGLSGQQSNQTFLGDGDWLGGGVQKVARTLLGLHLEPYSITIIELDKETPSLDDRSSKGSLDS
jgi:hypothetical protein